MILSTQSREIAKGQIKSCVMEIEITRDNVVAALENIDDSTPISFRQALESEDDYIRWYGAKGIGMKGDELGIPALLQALSRPALDLGGTDVRRISAWALAQFALHEVMTAYEEVVDKNELLREGLADVLGLIGDTRSIPKLASFVKEDSRSVALWAALSMSKIGDPAVEPICQLLDGDLDTERRVLLFDALSKINSSKSLHALNLYLKTLPDDVADSVRSFLQLDAPQD